MLRARDILFILLAVAATGCGSRKAAAPTTNRYERQPIREVTEHQLAVDSRLIDALSLQETGHLEEAVEAYARLVADEPGCAAAWYGLGQLLQQRGWTDSALHCARRAVALQKDNKWYLLALSDACMASGDLQGAIEALNGVERIMGITEPVSLQKQRLWEALGRSDKAMKEIEALADAMPQEKRYNAILAESCMQQKRYSKAKQYYDRVLAADPQDEYIHIQLAEYHKRTGHPAEADSEMVRAFANPRLDARTKMQLLASFYTEEEFYGSHSATAFRLMEQAMKQCDDPSEYALYYGDVLMRQRKYAEAGQQLEVALKRDSSRYEVWEALLICLTETPDRDDDLYAYARRAARLFPVHTLPHYIQGFHLLRQERYDEALVPLEQAAKWGFSKGYLEAETRALMAECYYRTEQYDKAWKCFEQYIALRPDDMATLNNYAYYLSEQGIELEKALAMSRKTIDAEPDNANSLDTYAWILHLLGRDKEALPYMEKAVRLDPQSETLKKHLEEIRLK